MPFATASDGCKIYCEISGRGEPLLLVMGQGADHRGWASLVPSLASEYQVIVFDHRGTGTSDKPNQPYSTRGFADDAIAVLDYFGIEQAHVFGISMGGRVGQWLAIDYPERVAALMLGCTTPGNAHGVARPADVDAMMRSGNIQKMLDEMVSPQWRESHPEFLQSWQQQDNPIPPFAQQLHYQASEQHNSWDDLPRITAPTLIIHGSDDRINVPANADLLEKRIAGARKHIIRGARHLFYYEFEEQTVAAIKNFLQLYPIKNKPVDR